MSSDADAALQGDGMAMKECDEKSGGIQVIARAAAIMRALGDHPQGLSLAGIAARVGLARSTVQRIVQALEAEGFIEPSGPQGGFQLGPSLAQLIYRTQVDIVSEVRPVLEALSAALEETVALYKLTGSSVTCIDRCIAERPLRVVFPLGTIPHPAHRLAPGRAILAALPAEQAERLLAVSLPAAEIARVLRGLEAVRDSGLAIDEDAFIPDIIGIAVPLSSHLGEHAIAVVLPQSRLERKRDRIAAVLSEARDEISDKIGKTYTYK
ncbi:IclR family transcriptional regulator [Pseudodonghicola sp.]|uniref:IclR family transcriptional regulator n=1 Tax=Pseudodonghicola sp. TaxID=1969463 RepID=UPI003A980EA5